MMRILTQVLSALTLCCCGLSGQTPAKPEFEVASIKPSPEPSGGGRMMRMGGRGGPGSKDPTRYTAQNMTMMDLLIQAYKVKRYQISGPEWLASAHFDINAKIPEGATKEEFGPMLQNLLAERFGLVVHHETRQMPVYDLVVFAKTGSKLKEHVEEAPSSRRKKGRHSQRRSRCRSWNSAATDFPLCRQISAGAGEIPRL